MKIFFCGDKENMPQILNERQPGLPFDKINNGSLSDQIRIYPRFEINVERRNKIKQMMEEEIVNQMKPITPCDLVSDPLNSTQSRNG